jgi:hypothetical protein
VTSSLGIAATTAVLRRVLQDAIPAAQLFGVLGAIDVTALPPDRIDVTTEKSTLNLFMYQTRPNTGWCTTELPSHDETGRRMTNPPLALDLSYMLSAYGARSFHSEILLGYGALVLHQTRVLPRDTVKAVFAGGALPPDLALLSTADLDGQEELIKLSMESLSIDELSRLWSVFGEKYRPSIAFQATVLLLRASDPALMPGPPVWRTRLAVTTSIHASIDRVEPVITTAGATVELLGTSLLTPATEARFGSGEMVTPDAGSTPMLVRLTLPVGLRAGVNTVRLQHRARFESDVRGGVESNVAPFTLRPMFAPTPAGTPDITVSAKTTTGQTTSATVTVKLIPPVGKRQGVALLLGQTETMPPPGEAPRSYSVPAPSREADVNEETDTIAFKVAVRSGPYVVRVRVDGAESELQPTGDVFDQPQVDLS